MLKHMILSKVILVGKDQEHMTVVIFPRMKMDLENVLDQYLVFQRNQLKSQIGILLGIRMMFLQLEPFPK